MFVFRDREADRGFGALVSVFLKDKGKRIRDKQKEPKGGEKDKGKRIKDKRGTQMPRSWPDKKG